MAMKGSIILINKQGKMSAISIAPVEVEAQKVLLSEIGSKSIEGSCQSSIKIKN